MFILPNYREVRVRIPLPVPPGNSVWRSSACFPQANLI